jgi:hypothetical protein
MKLSHFDGMARALAFNEGFLLWPELGWPFIQGAREEQVIRFTDDTQTDGFGLGRWIKHPSCGAE